MGVTFTLQFGVSIALLAMTGHQQMTVVHEAWMRVGDQDKLEAQAMFGCCGYLFENTSCREACGPSCGWVSEINELVVLEMMVYKNG